MTTKQIRNLTIRLEDARKNVKGKGKPSDIHLWPDEIRFLLNCMVDSASYHNAVEGVFRFVHRTAFKEEPTDEWVENAVMEYILENQES